MGAIAPSKMPKAKRKARRDDTDFDMYAEGGEVMDPEAGYVGSAGAPKLTDEQLMQRMQKAMQEGAQGRYEALKAEYEKRGQRFSKYKMASGGKTSSKVNEAGNYTKPGMRKSLFESIKSRAVQGTAAGQWSARKAQLLAKQYKAKGGRYKD